jgi:hypothetical protein
MGKVPLLEGTEISHGYKTNKFVPPLKRLSPGGRNKKKINKKYSFSLYLWT